MTANLNEAPLSQSQPPMRWRQAEGICLLGPVTGSGLVDQSYLIQRRDGQVLQVSELIHLVVEKVAPERTAEEIAEEVSLAFGRRLTVEGLNRLIEVRLGPLGLVENLDPGELPPAPPPRANPLLALRLRGTILPERAVRRLAAVLAPLYLTPVVVIALAALVVLDITLILRGGLMSALSEVLVTPAMLLGLFVLLTAGALIHELGHATACHYGGARPGVIGFGVYLVFPAFFTNVTDSYRLSRSGRLRTDLGGLYFNVWCLLAAGGTYLFTGSPLLLLVVLLMQIEMVQQLVPTVRFDGYFVLADLAGVPDLFSRIRPVVLSMIPGRPTDPRVVELRPAARRMVTVWVLTVIPTLVLALVWFVLNLPLLTAVAVNGIVRQADLVAAAFSTANLIGLTMGVLSIFLLALPLVGFAVLLQRLGLMAASPYLRARRQRRLRHGRRRAPQPALVRRPSTR